MKDKERIIEFEDGIFKDLCLKFIEYKRGSGLKYDESAEYTIRVLNKNLNKYDLSTPRLTKEIVEDLAGKLVHESSKTQTKRISLLRQFALFLNYIGIESYVFPVKYRLREVDNFTPYIFRLEQIQAIFKVSDSLKLHPKYPLYQIIYPTLLRVLYGCGLRLSEAICLKTNHVDLVNSLLFIEKSKKNKSRLVPMSASLTKNCIAYIQKMNLDMNSGGYFFSAPDHGKYSRCAVRYAIINIYARAGIPLLKNGLYPRIHDIRHTHAVHAIEKMSALGYDMYCSLPILSAYLGHNGVRETEKYLHLTDFKFTDILESQKKSYHGVIPEVFSDDKE
jgi:integrase